MTREEAERLQELFEQGYAIDVEDTEDEWVRFREIEPMEAYKSGDQIRIAKKEQEKEVSILEGSSRKYYIEETK